MTLQMIQNATYQLCSTDIFLDVMSAKEMVEYSPPPLTLTPLTITPITPITSITPPSPVFIEPSEPPSDEVGHGYGYVFGGYSYGGYGGYSIIWDYYSDRHDSYGHNKFMNNKSTDPKNHKNQNYHMRRQRRLKQPGGSSCDQRR